MLLSYSPQYGRPTNRAGPEGLLHKRVYMFESGSVEGVVRFEETNAMP